MKKRNHPYLSGCIVLVWTPDPTREEGLTLTLTPDPTRKEGLTLTPTFLTG